MSNFDDNSTFPATKEAAAAGVAVQTVANLLILFALGLYHSRRHLQPIRSRLYWQGEVTALVFIGATYLPVLNLFLPFIDENIVSSCAIFYASSHLFFDGIALLVIRAAHVFSVFEVSKIYTRTTASTNVEETIAQGKFFVKRAAWLQSIRVQTATFCFAIAFHFVVLYATDQVADDCSGSSARLAFAALAGVYAVLICYLAYSIYSLKDGLYVKRELIVCGVTGILAVVIFAILILAEGGDIHARFVASSAPFIVIGAQIVMPLYISYAWEWSATVSDSYSRRNDEELSTSLDDISSQAVGEARKKPKRTRKKVGLQKVLDDPIGNKIFLEFARLELSHENVLFYNEVRSFLHRYKNNLNDEGFEEQSRKMYETYFSENTPLEINVSGRIAQRIQLAGLASTSQVLEGEQVISVFNSAKKEIFTLLETDVYSRFKRSEQYQKYLIQNVDTVFEGAVVVEND